MTAAALDTFLHATLGRTGRRVHRLGISASYGLDAAGVEHAIERGVNYLYWGSLRTEPFAEGVRRAVARGKRDELVVVLQSYVRFGWMLGPSICRALKRLGLDSADVLLLGWWNKEPPGRIVDAALRLRERGLVKHLALSTHERPLIPRLAPGSPFDLFHVRYNAAHRGAEREVLDALPAAPAERPGLVAFTATRWGTLLKPLAGEPADTRVPSAGDCYRFALSNPKVDVVMTGTGGLEQMKAALDAVEKGPMTGDELAWIRARGDRVHEAARRKGPLSASYWRSASAH
ncbi:MAG TPA: aldo/keto reductase [Planctomycetota bacterium]|nr:aldo/keto reductase [Planctomycetota bacterium]